MNDAVRAGLSPEGIELFERAVLCWLATASTTGAPNVSPKEVFHVASPERLLIADIASPKSTRNLRMNPRVCVAAVDVFEQIGVQVYGTARTVVVEEPEFEALAAPLRELAGPRFAIRSVIEVTVESTARIVAPSLWMYPDVDPAERRAAVLATYRVRELDA